MGKRSVRNVYRVQIVIAVFYRTPRKDCPRGRRLFFCMARRKGATCEVTFGWRGRNTILSNTMNESQTERASEIRGSEIVYENKCRNKKKKEKEENRKTGGRMRSIRELLCWCVPRCCGRSLLSGGFWRQGWPDRKKPIGRTITTVQGNGLELSLFITVTR